MQHTTGSTLHAARLPLIFSSPDGVMQRFARFATLPLTRLDKLSKMLAYTSGKHLLCLKLFARCKPI
jgi:hypothetical protein